MFQLDNSSSKTCSTDQGKMGHDTKYFERCQGRPQLLTRARFGGQACVLIGCGGLAFSASWIVSQVRAHPNLIFAFHFNEPSAHVAGGWAPVQKAAGYELPRYTSERPSEPLTSCVCPETQSNDQLWECSSHKGTLLVRAANPPRATIGPCA